MIYYLLDRQKVSKKESKKESKKRKVDIMVLKWLNSAKNWSFLEGEISYKETNVY